MSMLLYMIGDNMSNISWVRVSYLATKAARLGGDIKRNIHSTEQRRNYDKSREI